MMLTRRGLIGTLLAAPVIIRTPGLLMPVKAPLITAGLAELLTEVLREQDAWRHARLNAWAKDFNLTRLPADPRWRTSLA